MLSVPSYTHNSYFHISLIQISIKKNTFVNYLLNYLLTYLFIYLLSMFLFYSKKPYDFSIPIKS